MRRATTLTCLLLALGLAGCGGADGVDAGSTALPATAAEQIGGDAVTTPSPRAGTTAAEVTSVPTIGATQVPTEVPTAVPSATPTPTEDAAGETSP
jgi:hypothetical protein